MVRHIVMWDLKEGFTEDERKINLDRIKSELENLKNLIEGVISLEVIINPLDGSNKEIMLNSVLKDEESLKNYQIHPEHIKAGKFIKEVTCNRACIDYKE